MALHVGELVERYSHKRIFFSYYRNKRRDSYIVWRGIRLVADAPLEDLISIDQREHKKG